MTPLANQLRWYIALRVLVVVSVLGLYGLAQLAGPGETVGPPEAPEILSHQFLVRIGGLTCLLTLLHIGLFQLFRGARREPLLAYLQFGGDLLLITLLIHNSGDIASPFSMLYLIVIALASTLLRRRAGVTVATAAYLCYLCLVLIAYRNPILEAGQGLHNLGALGEAVLRDGRLLYNLTTHLLGFYTVALLTSYLAGDVTRAQRELEAKSEVLADLQVVHRDVIESISSGLITTDLEGLIVGVNRAGALILHRESGLLVGTRIQDLPLFSPQRWAELTAASEQRGRLRSEVEIDTGEGRAFVGFSISQLTDSSGTHRGYIVIFQDLSSWQRLQEQVRMKDRMAAVGELAAGLAHEIGNPLAAISGSVQMLAQARQSAENDPGQTKLLEILLRESQRLDRTIKGFLRFARPREGTQLRFDIARLLSENFELLRNSQEVSENHRLEVDIDPPDAPMVADPDQVSQIFWNLARNSLRAMPDGGTLRVVGRLVEGRYRLQVIDTGHGMSAEQQANLFHPFRTFFETGTGIGMAIVYRIVQSHQGTISVESRRGQGTVITVELPIVETAVETLEEVLR
jgi:two-component system, NtrC family, sensor histidine kinase PilS